MVSDYLLRSVFGVASAVVFGVQLYPFQAHAWVEAGDVIVTDDVDHCRMYTPVARYA